MIFISQIAQIIISLILMGLILMQSKGTGLSATFGGSSGEYRSKRGLEKGLMYITIFVGILFVANSLALILFS